MERLLLLLLRAQRLPVVGKLVYRLMQLRGTHVPPNVEVGEGVRFMHGGHHLVIGRQTIIKNHVTIFHGVTIGGRRPWMPYGFQKRSHVILEDDCVLCSMAVVVLPEEGDLVVARGSIVGANSVLTQSTGPWEIWAGQPARKVGMRDVEAEISAGAYVGGLKGQEAADAVAGETGKPLSRFGR